MESPWGRELGLGYWDDQGSIPLCVLQLDPADRAVLRIADERDAVQKKTFTKWINKHLLKAGLKINELFEDLRDGHHLISLLEVLAHDILPRERGHMRFHKIQNVQIALDFLRMKGIRLVNIRSDEIVDGNPKLTLGLIWTIILHFQVSDVVVPGQEDISARDALLLWSRRMTEGYPGIKITNFSNSWCDGKAFLSIIHRNRPELIDFRQARHNSNKHNLEIAFSIAEKEFGVTRLLDPEDVDVPHPDEKSIITYVSSLYDVFPQVPSVEQYLKDNERQLKVEEYRELASSLILWLREASALMRDRNFPHTVLEMRALVAEHNRFKLEDVPPRLEHKQKLLKLFEEIRTVTPDMSQVGIAEELSPKVLEQMWSAFAADMHDRDTVMQAEMLRLEHLGRIAEKLHRECKFVEEGIEDLEGRIQDAVRRSEVMHPFEAQRNCEAMQRSLQNMEDTVKAMQRDVQTLQDNRFHKAQQLHSRVSELQAGIAALCSRLHSAVVEPLLHKSYVEEGRTVTKRKEVVMEVRLVETNPAFRHIQDCLDWIDNLQRSLDSLGFGTDLPTIQEQLRAHRKTHQEITTFRSQIDKCISNLKGLSSEEQKLYTQKLSSVEVAYSLLSNTSSRRMKRLEELNDFLQSPQPESKFFEEAHHTELLQNRFARDHIPAEHAELLIRELRILSMNPAQREAEWHSLKDQIQQLLADSQGMSRHDLKHLKKELAECEQVFKRTMAEAAAREVGSRSAFQVLIQQIDSVSRELDVCDHQLSSMILTPLPHNNLAVQDAFRKYREFQEHFDGLEKEVTILQRSSRQLSPTSPQVESKLNVLVQKLQKSQAISYIYMDRLKHCEMVVTGLDELRHAVSECEHTLILQGLMPSDITTMRSINRELADMFTSMQQQEPLVDHVSEVMSALGHIVDKSRPGSSRHQDLEALRNEATDLMGRWSKAKAQVTERLQATKAGQDLLSQYQNGLSGEEQWLVKTQQQVATQPPLRGDPTDTRAQLQHTVAILNQLNEHKFPIERVNAMGGKFICEIKGRLADSFDHMLQELTTEQDKLADFERILKKDSQMGDEAHKVRAQLESHRGVHDKITSRQQPVLSLIYKAEQLTENYQEELTPEQVTELTTQSTLLKAALDKVMKTSDRRLCHLKRAAEELGKLEEEMTKFQTWMTTANSELDRQEECLQRFEDLKPLAEKQKELSSDVVSQQADIRFMSMAAQKYMEEAKLYKLEIDSFRADRVRPARHSLISMECVSADDVKDRLKDVTESYHDLSGRCNSLGDRLADLSGKHRQFNDAAFKLLDWLTETENQLASLKQESASPEASHLENQLQQLKTLSKDAVSQRSLLDEMQRRGQDLTNSLSGQATDKREVSKLQDTMADITGRYQALTADITARTTGLQAALTQSQDVTQAMDSLMSWLDSAEQAVQSQTPVSLHRPVLNTQLQGFSVLQADIVNHQSALEAVRASASKLVKKCDMDIARSVEQRLAAVEKKFSNVQARSQKRDRDLQDVDQGLHEFREKLELCSSWVQGGIQRLDSKDLARLPSEDMVQQLECLAQEKKTQEMNVGSLKVLADHLARDPRTGDASAVTESVAELQRSLAAFDSLLAARHHEADAKEQQGAAFESAKTLAQLWLSQMEARLDEFEPVAIDVAIVEQQLAQLQPMFQEFEDYAPKIDEVNDLGSAYEAMVNPDEQPMSPVRRMGRNRRLQGILSPRLRTPSPTFSMSPSAQQQSPLSSESSGVSSRKSSADNLLLDDLSETQQQLLDINQRYEILGERLADRQQELRLMLTSIRTFLQDLQDLLHWLDIKDAANSDNQLPLPANEKDAKKQLKQHETVHRELLSKEGLVEDIRKKAQELLKTRRGVLGEDSLQQKLQELDDKWHGLRASSEQRRKSLEDLVSDLRDLRELEDQLIKWTGQKERMLDVLGPIAMEPAMLTSQLEQVKVLKEEFLAQEPTYDLFLNCGHAIIDRSPQSQDGQAIGRKMDSVSKAWSRLQSRLKERSKSLTSVQGISSEFAGLTHGLADWMSDFSDRLDSMGPISQQPDKQEQQLEQVEKLECSLQEQQSRLDRARDLCRQLCDKAKDPSTKGDLRIKLAALEKDFGDTTKKLEARKSALEAARQQAAQFKADCHDLLNWVSTAADRLQDAEAISSDMDILHRQTRQNKNLQQEIGLKESDIKELLDKGNKLIQGSSPSAEVKAIADTLGELQQEWGRLRQEAKEREERLAAADGHAQHFSEQLDKLVMWLNMTEEKLDSMKTQDLSRKDIEQTLRELQGVETELQRKGQTVDRLKQQGQVFKDSVDTGHDDIDGHLHAAQQRWDKINKAVTERSSDLEELSQKLGEVQDTLAEADHTLTKWEDKLDAHNRGLGPSAKDPKHIDKIKSLLEDSGWLSGQLDTADTLMDSMEADGGNATNLRAEKDRLSDRHHALQEQLKELVADMETGSQIVQQFQGLLRTAGGQLSEMEAELDSKVPTSRDDAELEQQNTDIREFLARLDDKMENLDDLKCQAKDLANAGYVSDPEGLKSQVEGLCRQHAALKEKVTQRLKDIESSQQGLKKLTRALNTTRQGITQAAASVDAMGPTAGEVKAIKALQDELKSFMKSTVDPLQKQLDEVISQGQDLIKSAPPGSNTSGLETDLESLTDRWAELSEKVSEREKNLDSALLHAGKFQDAMASLLTWLTETEEMVASQKQPSPEQRVIRAQVQEQKLVQKMVSDRAPNVQAVKESGLELLKKSSKDRKEQQKLEGQLRQLQDRWDALNGKVSERAAMLEEVQRLANKFTEVLEPLNTWLDATDKKFAALEPQSADAEGIEKIINELQKLRKEADDQEASVKQLAATGKDLQDYCKGEDVILVQLKIDDMQKRYGELRSRVEDSLDQMEEALPLAQHFQEAHQGFLAWANRVEPELRVLDHPMPESQDTVEELLAKLAEVQPLLDIINAEGAELSEVTPGDASLRVEDVINKDNKRFDNLREQIEKRVEKAKLTREKSREVIGELGELLDWFSEADDKLKNPSPVTANPDTLHKQLIEQKAMNEDISTQKAKARDALSSGKKLLNDHELEEETTLRTKMDDLKQTSDGVSSAANERLSNLQQALPLARHFREAHTDLVNWLDEVEPAVDQLDIPSVDADQVKKQQEKARALKQEIQDRKPAVDRLNKTGAALASLCNPEGANEINAMLDDDNRRMDEVRTRVRDRSNSIDLAMQQSAEFSDKLENMLESLTVTAEQVKHAEPISAHPDKLREQLEETKAIEEDMEMRQAALESVKSAAEELLKQAGTDQDEAVRDVRHKLEELMKLFKDIQEIGRSRQRALDSTLSVAEKFWDDLSALNSTIKDLQDSLTNAEKPALEPEAIREQQEELEALKDDIEASQQDLEEVQQTGDLLMGLVGDREAPEVQQTVEDAGASLAAITDQYSKRSSELDAALTRAVHFQDRLMKMLVWLKEAEEEMAELPPVASEFNSIKEQWEQLRTFKASVDPKHMEVEGLNQQLIELTKDSSPEQAIVLKEPVAELNTRWGVLVNSIGDRQRELQMALLLAGQFDHAFNELRKWMATVSATLDEVEPVYGDPRMVEIELAKLRIVQNDISAHQESVDSIGEEAQRLMGTEGATEAQGLKARMDEMSQAWDDILTKSHRKQDVLEDALREAQGFTGEMQDAMMKINDLESQMITSKPVGGLPETAKEQLERFMDVYNTLEKVEREVESLTAMGGKLSGKSSGPALANIQQNLVTLHQRWDHVRNRAKDRKAKLEEAVNKAGNFHEEHNKFIAWLTETEKTLNNLQPVSRLVDRVTTQIEDHKVLQKDISSHREAMVALDKLGTHLKYFSQKQDVVLIKNLLSSLQHRWEKIVSRSAERTRHLERGYKEARQFHDTWKDLILWLVEAEKALEAETSIANEPNKIKEQIIKHKEFQRRLGAKQPVYDGVNKTGRSLKDRCPGDDMPTIQAMLTELKSRWNSVCSKSVDRQRKLEEGLLLSGQFSEALDALLDWLAKVEPALAEDTPVHGDLDTVSSFLENHKVFQQELGARATTVAFVQKSAKEMISKAEGDTSNLQSDLIELNSTWDRVCKLSVSKQERLEQAHRLSEEFHKKAQQLLDWLSDAERQLRYKGPIPDEETLILQQMEEHKVFEESLLRQEGNLRETLNIGQDIMKRCHPDAVPVMKQWLSVLRTRWEELSGLGRQRNQRLVTGLSDLRRSNHLLAELLAWLNGAEVTLTDLEGQVIPQDVTIIEQLLKEHQDFQNEMSTRQPDVDRLIKADKRRTSLSQEPLSQIPVLRSSTPRTPTRRIPVRVGGSGRITPDRLLRNTPEHFGRRTPELFSGRQTPDYGAGRRTPEPQFHNPRVGALFNKWRNVWLMAMERQRRLQDMLDHLNEIERLKNFEFEDWRKRYLRWMHHNKARIMDFFRRQDRDRDGRVSRKEFIDGILASKFPTSKLEMEKVADIFDKDGDGFINYKQFVAALKPDRDGKPPTAEELIQDEVRRQVCKCTCIKQFKIHKIGEGKYRFGDSQKLRLVRILRSTVMVRVGGGWVALDEFLVKNDPCREILPTKGRTNVELRENFILAAGVSQSMAGFVSKSPIGSSHSESSTNSPTSRSTNSSVSGPITKIREKTVHPTPWRQRVKTSPDGEVTQIMSRTDEEGQKITKTKVIRDMRSPYSGLQSPRSISSPASHSSSRAGSSMGSRPTSRTGSETSSDHTEPEVYTTMQSETRNLGGRKDTTVTYQTHVVETRTVTLPSATHTKISRIPKMSPAKTPKKK